MKKYFIFTIILFSSLFMITSVKAEKDYLSYQKISFKNGGKFLEDFSDSDYNNYYPNVLKRKFIGWNTYTVTSNAKVEYVVETLFSFYNNGYSAIKYEMNYGEKRTTIKSLNVSGSIGITGSGSKKTFKGGLDTKLKIDYENSCEEIITESFKINTDIDAGTILNIYIKGEGKITNGVASQYIFWINSAKGGYEIFTATSQTYRMEKLRV